jgi:hypothetical protein
MTREPEPWETTAVAGSFVTIDARPGGPTPARGRDQACTAYGLPSTSSL